MKSLNICMVSDFFYPNVGGIENHIYQLSQRLLENLHKVVVICHADGERRGVRFMNKGLKVYYLNIKDVYNYNTLPTVFLNYPIIRYILIREKIDVVHSHSAFSTLGLESVIYSKILNLPIITTDHSLFGFADLSSILTNKVLQICLSVIDHVICVSHTSKENTALRANLNPLKISVIPNAIETKSFVPKQPKNKMAEPEKEEIEEEEVKILVLSRLVYRKGIDFLVDLIPHFCKKYHNIKFIIGGEGPKREILQIMIDNLKLNNKVKLVGGVKSDYVNEFLGQGDLFLNLSLTEAFCMAILEAASCGLEVVSTNVGGVPEVLPPHLIRLSNPDINSLKENIDEAIIKIINIKNNKKNNEEDDDEYKIKLKKHKLITEMYDWSSVAKRVLVVYSNVISTNKKTNIKNILANFNKTGFICGKFVILIVFILFCIASIVDFCVPEKDIEIAEDCRKLNKLFNKKINEKAKFKIKKKQS